MSNISRQSDISCRVHFGTESPVAERYDGTYSGDRHVINTCGSGIRGPNHTFGGDEIGDTVTQKATT
jgi:hypothetical protein